MDYIKISDSDNTSEPRYLTKEEIDRIIDSYPLISETEHAKLFHKNMRQLIKNELETHKITPDGIDDLIEYIITQHNRAVSIAGEPVGAISCEAIGASATQGTLNTFHQSGAGTNQTAFIDNVKDKLYVKKNSKGDMVIIYPKNPKATIEEIFSYRSKIMEIGIMSLLNRYEYIRPEDFKEEEWHRKAKTFFNKDFKVTSKVMRLHFNLDKLYKYKITISDIYKKIIAKANPVIILPSPTRIGIIDIFVNLDDINNIIMKYNIPLTEEQDISFFEIVIKNEFNKTIVSGIEGLSNFFVSRTEFYKIIGDEKLCPKIDNLIDVKKYSNKNVWIIELDFMVIGSSSFTIDFIKQEFEKLKIQIIKHEGERMIIVIPDNETPISYLTKNNFYNYSIQTYGRNLGGVLKLDFVDKSKTYCTNPHVMWKYFGIEAVRKMLIKEIYKLFFSAEISYPNIILPVDFITNSWYPKPLNSTGLANQPEGPLSKASIDRAAQHLIEAAITQKVESMNSVSSSIICGQRIPVGNGYVIIGCEDNGEIYINENTYDYMVPKDKYVPESQITNIITNNYNENEDIVIREYENKNLIINLKAISDAIRNINLNINYDYQEDKQYVIKNKELLLEPPKLKIENLDPPEELLKILEDTQKYETKKQNVYDKDVIKNYISTWKSK